MIRVGLIGGRGYVGQELLQLLTGSPHFHVCLVGSHSAARKPITDEFASLDLPDLQFAPITEANIRRAAADVWILAQPNGQASRCVPLIEQVAPQAKILDLSSDFRFDDSWVYGLPEKNAQELLRADRISNPGCYATAGLLALLPIANCLVQPPSLFGVSGYSGAGKTPNDKNDPMRLADNLLPYSLTEHLHEREISRHLGVDVRFTPHVASFFRGISVTVHATIDRATSQKNLYECYRRFFDGQRDTRVVNQIPEIRNVTLTDNCLVGGFGVDPNDSRHVIIVSVLDNLRKGAASQALHNLHLMFEVPGLP